MAKVLFTPLARQDLTEAGDYMVFYHISGETVWIDRILYGRRDYLAILFGNELTDEME